MRIAGADPAKLRDAFGFVVIDIEDDVIKVVAAKAWHRQEYIKVEKEIKDIVEKLQIKTVFLEINNTGTHVAEMLRKYKVPLYPITTVSKITDPKKVQKGLVMGKSDIVGFTIKLLQDKKLVFPVHPKSTAMKELLNQFIQFQESITPSGVPSYSAPAGAHDDLVMSLLLAIHGSRKYLRNKEKLFIKKGPLPYGYSR